MKIRAITSAGGYDADGNEYSIQYNQEYDYADALATDLIKGQMAVALEEPAATTGAATTSAVTTSAVTTVDHSAGTAGDADMSTENQELETGTEADSSNEDNQTSADDLSTDNQESEPATGADSTNDDATPEEGTGAENSDPVFSEAATMSVESTAPVDSAAAQEAFKQAGDPIAQVPPADPAPAAPRKSATKAAGK